MSPATDAFETPCGPHNVDVTLDVRLAVDPIQKGEHSTGERDRRSYDLGLSGALARMHHRDRCEPSAGSNAPRNRSRFPLMP